MARFLILFIPVRPSQDVSKTCFLGMIAFVGNIRSSRKCQRSISFSKLCEAFSVSNLKIEGFQGSRTRPLKWFRGNWELDQMWPLHHVTKKSIIAMRNSNFNTDTKFTKSISQEGKKVKGLWWAEAIAIHKLFSVNEWKLKDVNHIHSRFLVKSGCVCEYTLLLT